VWAEPARGLGARQLTGRQVIEVVLQRKVIDHVIWARRCGACRKRILPRLESREIGVQGKRRFGVSVQALVATLHIGCRVPMRVMGQLMWELFGLRVSDGEVVKLLDGVKRAGEPEIARLRESVRHAAAVCADETGWREDGENGYLWGFFTEPERYFEYRKSRAALVPEEILGEDFGGVVTCDFYAGYNQVGVLQRCWFHLLKDAREVAELNVDRPEVVGWVESLQALYQEAKAVASACLELPANCRARRRQRRRLERAAAALARPYAKAPDAPQRVLLQRILKSVSRRIRDRSCGVCDQQPGGAQPAAGGDRAQDLRRHPLPQRLRHPDGADESAGHLGRTRHRATTGLPGTAPAHPRALTSTTAPQNHSHQE